MTRGGGEGGRGETTEATSGTHDGALAYKQTCMDIAMISRQGTCDKAARGRKRTQGNQARLLRQHNNATDARSRYDAYVPIPTSSAQKQIRQWHKSSIRKKALCRRGLLWAVPPPPPCPNTLWLCRRHPAAPLPQSASTAPHTPPHRPLPHPPALPTPHPTPPPLPRTLSPTPLAPRRRHHHRPPTPHPPPPVIIPSAAPPRLGVAPLHLHLPTRAPPPPPPSPAPRTAPCAAR